jgi:YidC/Oxa1 family membrane protein insertase
LNIFNIILVNPIFNLLALIYAVVPGHDFGVAVIILTLLVRLALWPVINKQLHSQRAMQQIAPAVNDIRAKAKGDKQLESQMLMELYKEKGVNPFASLVPLLVQLPLLLALFVVLRDIVKPGEIAHLAYGPIQQLGAIKDIIHNSGAFKPTFLGIFNLAKPNIWLAAAAGVTQYFQSRSLMPKSQAGQTPEAKAMMTATTGIFPILTFLVGLSLPSALPLFWTVTSLVMLYQQSRAMRENEEELEHQADAAAAKRPKRALGKGQHHA